MLFRNLDFNNDYTPYTGLTACHQQDSFVLIACQRGLLKRPHYVVAEISGIEGDYHAKSPIIHTLKEARRERDYLMSQDSGFGVF